MTALTLAIIGETLTVAGAATMGVAKVVEIREHKKNLPEDVVNFIGNEAINDYKEKQENQKEGK